MRIQRPFPFTIIALASLALLWSACATDVISQIKRARIAEADKMLGKPHSALLTAPVG